MQPRLASFDCSTDDAATPHVHMRAISERSEPLVATAKIYPLILTEGAGPAMSQAARVEVLAFLDVLERAIPFASAAALLTFGPRPQFGAADPDYVRRGTSPGNPRAREVAAAEVSISQLLKLLMRSRSVQSVNPKMLGNSWSG